VLFLQNTRVTFGGLYRAILADNNDPENFGRLRLQIPQVFGDEITDWVWPAGGAPRQGLIPYAAITDYTTQSPAANTATVINLGQIDEITEIVVVNNSRIIFNHTGTYNIQWSGQFSNSGNSPTDVTVWNRNNGVDVPGSTGVITVPSSHGGVDGRIVSGWNSVATFAAGSYTEFWWSTASTGVSLISYPALTSPVRPATPSMAVSVTLVGNYLPNPTDGIWVAFEGGDPNFPVWIGTF
jgi:hypothetical protein